MSYIFDTGGTVMMVHLFLHKSKLHADIYITHTHTHIYVYINIPSIYKTTEDEDTN